MRCQEFFSSWSMRVLKKFVDSKKAVDFRFLAMVGAVLKCLWRQKMVKKRINFIRTWTVAVAAIVLILLMPSPINNVLAAIQSSTPESTPAVTAESGSVYAPLVISEPQNGNFTVRKYGYIDVTGKV